MDYIFLKEVEQYGKIAINNTGNYVTINAKGGTDFMASGGAYVSIYGGDGSGKIFNDGANKVIYQFGKNEGVDTISGFTSSDTLYITSGTFTTTSLTRLGKDFTFKLNKVSAIEPF